MSKTSEYFDKHKDRLVARAAKRLGDFHDGEDVVSEAFLRAVQYEDKWDPKRGKFEYWFNGILENCIRDFRKGTMSDPLDDYEILEDTEEEELVRPRYDTVELNQEYDKVVAQIFKRKGVQKDMLYLYFIEQHAPRDIAQILELDENTIKVAMWRFRREMERLYA